MKKDINHHKKIEDTLDYYDESITINAVGSLLNNSNVGHDEMAISEDIEDFNDDRIKESFVRGFEREREEEAREYLYNNNMDYSKNSTLNRQKREVKYPDSYEPPSRRANKPSPPKANYKTYSKDYAFNYSEDHTNQRNTSNFNKIGFVTFLIFLSILFFLVYKINSVNRQLDYMQTVEVSALPQGLDIYGLIEQRDELVQKIAVLEATVDSLQQEVESLSSLSLVQEETTARHDMNQEPLSSTSINQPPLNSQTFASRTHVVQQGDNLSTISELFYGTRHDYQRIVEANNLNTDFLEIGQVLVIP